MKAETQYTIAFIVATFADPTANKWSISGSSGTKNFDSSGKVTQDTIALRESGAGNIQGNGNGFAFSEVRCSGGGAENFDLKLNGRRFDGAVYNEARERYSGSIDSGEVRFDTGETYRLQ